MIGRNVCKCSGDGKTCGFSSIDWWEKSRYRLMEVGIPRGVEHADSPNKARLRHMGRTIVSNVTRFWELMMPASVQRFVCVPSKWPIFSIIFVTFFLATWSVTNFEHLIFNPFEHEKPSLCGTEENKRKFIFKPLEMFVFFSSHLSQLDVI